MRSQDEHGAHSPCRGSSPGWSLGWVASTPLAGATSARRAVRPSSRGREILIETGRSQGVAGRGFSGPFSGTRRIRTDENRRPIEPVDRRPREAVRGSPREKPILEGVMEADRSISARVSFGRSRRRRGVVVSAVLAAVGLSAAPQGLGVPIAAASDPVCVVHDDFDPISRWANGLDWCAGSWSGPTFLGGMMQVEASNNCQVRVRSTFKLEGDVDVFITGECYWSGTYLATHVKHWLGLYHSGSTSDPSLELRQGFNGENEIFAGYVHYRIDLNGLLGAQSGATKSFDVKFSKIGNTIQIYHLSGGSYTLLANHTILDPTANLYFEMAGSDATSYGAGHARYDVFTAVADCPAPCNIDCSPAPCCFGTGGCLELSSSDCAAMGGTHQVAVSACAAASCPVQVSCAGDLNGDGQINGDDMQLFVNLLLTAGGCP